jgi:hypothetical protein
MITSARDLVGRLREFAVVAIKKGAAARCSIHLRVESGGLLIVAYAGDGSGRHAAQLVSWHDVLAFKGAVSRAMDEAVAEATSVLGPQCVAKTPTRRPRPSK